MCTSFIIPAHNEEVLLPHTLAAIHDAARALSLDHEIILADDASTDATAAIARAGGAVVASHDRRQIAATRNLGACAATGDVLIFVDADTRITPEAVAQALGAIRAGAVGGGASVSFDGHIPLYARCILPVVTVLFRVARLTGGCFVFCTRAAYDASGGWDETLFASEEIAFARALKRHGRFVIIRGPVITSGRKLRAHSGREIFATIARIALSGGKGVRDRSALDIWYAPRRPDPSSPSRSTPTVPDR